METAMKLDMVFEPSEEAKVCLTCTRKKCLPECNRIKRELKRISGKETKLERVHRLVEEEYEKAMTQKRIENPLGYALYNVWERIDKEYREKVERQIEARMAKASEKG